MEALQYAFTEVDEGTITVVTIRETDSALGPLLWVLVGLGVAALVATAIFWWLTRPTPVPAQLHVERTES